MRFSGVTWRCRRWSNFTIPYADRSSLCRRTDWSYRDGGRVVCLPGGPDGVGISALAPAAVGRLFRFSPVGGSFPQLVQAAQFGPDRGGTERIAKECIAERVLARLGRRTNLHDLRQGQALRRTLHAEQEAASAACLHGRFHHLGRTSAQRLLTLGEFFERLRHAGLRREVQVFLGDGALREVEPDDFRPAGEVGHAASVSRHLVDFAIAQEDENSGRKRQDDHQAARREPGCRARSIG